MALKQKIGIVLLTIGVDQNTRVFCIVVIPHKSSPSPKKIENYRYLHILPRQKTDDIIVSR